MHSDEVVENAWLRARAQCECERAAHAGHAGRCTTLLQWTARGIEHKEGAWEAHRTGDPRLGGWEAANACAVLCWACYQQVQAVVRVPKRAGVAPAMGLYQSRE
jgi:hypothetical protein